MSTDYFYADLPVLTSFLDITNPQNFTSVPRDWYILITDVVGSTQAIESGRYKEVNLLGACSIIAILNIAEQLEIPFIFGGDGASILIPPGLFAPAQAALLATRQLAQDSFNLNLRVGAVPVAVVKDANYDVKIAKLRISENYVQGNFTGGGLTYATDLLKHPDTTQGYCFQEGATDVNADFSGLECRWQDIFSQHGETVSLIAMALADSEPENDLIYKNILETLSVIYGSEQNFHPVAADHLHLSFKNQNLAGETKVQVRSQNFWHQQFYLLKIKLENLLGWLFMRFRMQVGSFNWGDYLLIVAASTDHQKFDDLLRMVIASTTVQRQQLTDFLERQYQNGSLVYGLHVSDRALMTCLVFERNGRQVHFIDGADGGYALAAKAMKARLNQRRS
ncbi:hypothetical protein DO97_09695 [Neosynechococcus sphagnicola sy1]|uniref:Adenylate cyclase n=1 Tax=Neosynechococcus sphagnicola sy1 TaxID=1497020 RepID=A0A098TKH5_9CYAN|nr:DUF3095 domain-containing protein [Neosynechococcus sphagnicola]KGF72352.1 hypothetical protein DO97_09695 [Neosynechococcus sphagnicola sy1]